MRLRLPTPLHGWRALVGEIGVVVIGVLVALAAQQFAEGLKEDGLRRQTREAARAELKGALDQFVNRRSIQACIDRRMSEIAGLLEDSSRPGYKPPIWIGRPQYWPFNASAWNAATAGGHATLLTFNDQNQLGGLYDRLREVAQLQRDEQQAWADIRQLENLDVVDPQTRSSVRSALAQARLIDWNIRVDLEVTIARARKLGVVLKVDQRSASPSICLPTTTPRAEAVRRVNAFFNDTLGEP